MSELYLKKIILTQFRNHSFQEINFCNGLNCITGKNGEGKTNILDSIYYICMCKSRLNGLDKYVVQHDEKFLRIEALFDKKNRQEKIVAKIQLGKPKIIEKNNAEYEKFSNHIGFLPIVAIMPDDTSLIKEGSEERRKFLDNTLSQIDREYLQHLIKYNRLLKQRNALLKQFGENVDTHLLSTYNDQMEIPAHYIFNKRKKFIIEFIPIFKKYYKKISNDSEEVNLSYQSQLLDQSFLECMKSCFQKDCFLQRTNSGIHKDDLIFYLGDNPMKRYASQGQLKSFVLSLGLARYEILKKNTSIFPILLLDDIFDKLDSSRVEQLLNLLSGDDFGQIFLTDTDKNRIKEIILNFNREFSIYTLKDKKIIKSV